MRLLFHCLSLLLPALATSALAQDASSLNQRSLAATCANCHGSDGRTLEGSAIPALAGMPREYLISQMKAFKEGTREATVMHQLAKGYSDAQIESIASYFAATKR